jgi:hypothetical protein
MEPVMIGAGLGAAGSALTGRNPFQGALLGAAGGGLTGGVSNLMGGGSLLGASTVPASSVGNAVVANSIDDMGMMFNPATGTYLNPASYVGASTPLPVFTGGQGVFTNAYDLAKDAIPSSITNNLTPTNLMYANSLLSQLNDQPQMGASPISVYARPGTAPQSYAFNTGTALRRV